MGGPLCWATSSNSSCFWGPGQLWGLLGSGSAGCFSAGFLLFCFSFQGRTCSMWTVHGAAAAGLHRSHSNAGSEPPLPPTSQLVAARISNPLSEARNRTRVLSKPSQILNPLSPSGNFKMAPALVELGPEFLEGLMLWGHRLLPPCPRVPLQSLLCHCLWWPNPRPSSPGCLTSPAGRMGEADNLSEDTPPAGRGSLCCAGELGLGKPLPPQSTSSECSGKHQQVSLQPGPAVHTSGPQTSQAGTLTPCGRQSQGPTGSPWWRQGNCKPHLLRVETCPLLRCLSWGQDLIRKQGLCRCEEGKGLGGGPPG